MKPTPLPHREDRSPDVAEITQLREVHYNAVVAERIDVHADLAKFRVVPDAGVPEFEPGQYVALGLGYWEPRIVGAQEEILPVKQYWKLVRRAYSISCPLLNDEGALQSTAEAPFLEFYVTLIRQAAEAPALTPRLFALQAGDRLHMNPRIVGSYTLSGISPADTVVFIGTGTGEAPHNAMAAKLLAGGHRGNILVATCVRHWADLGYLQQHRRLEELYPNYRYLFLTTRQTAPLPQNDAGYLGNERLQAAYQSGRLQAAAQLDFNPRTTHVFLCGNPQMIGIHRPSEPPPAEPGMLQLLEADGFRSVHSNTSQAVEGSVEGVGHSVGQGPGTVRFEKYW